MSGGGWHEFETKGNNRPNLTVLTKIEFAKSILYGLYIFTVLHLVFISGNDHRHLDLLNFDNPPGLQPFGDKIGYFSSWGFTRLHDTRFFLKEVFGNLLLLSPITFILMLEGYQKTGRIILIAFLISLFIETTQYVTGIGHADVDDLILNTTGAWLAIPFVRWMRSTEKWLQLDKTYRLSSYNHL